jgi:PKD repeat protein
MTKLFKKALPLSFWICAVSLSVTHEMRAQFTLVATPSVQCYSSGNTATIIANSPPVGTTSYTWSSSNFYFNSCGAATFTVAASGPSGSTIHATFPCCSAYGFSCSAYNGSTFLGSAWTTFSYECTQVSGFPSANVICAGNTAILSASGMNTYTWSTGSQGHSVAVSPSSAGNACYTVTGTALSGCSTSAVYCQSVIAAASPTIAVAGPTNVCANVTNGYTATLGFNSYTWMPGPIPGLSPAQLITPVTSGCYTVWATASNSCVPSATFCLLVQPAPTLSFSSSPSGTILCLPGSMTLTASGANTYTWVPGNINGPVAVISPTTVTSYTLGGTGANGCNAYHNFWINPIQNFSLTTGGGGTICSGSSAFLSACCASNYTWTGVPSGSVAGGNATVSPNSNTCYSVTGTVGNCSNTASVCVTVLPPASISLTSTTLPNGYVTFTATAGGAGSSSHYSWYTGTQSYTATGSPTATFQFPTNGNYNVTVVYTGPGTCATQSNITVNVANACTITPAFSYSIGTGGAVLFTDNSTGTNSQTTYTWNFGDGTFSNAQGPVAHTYTSAGLYFVTLHTGNPSHCASITQSLGVSGIPCIANAGFTLLPTTTPQHWIAVPASPWNVAVAQWPRGDGSQSNSLYTSHQYSAAGMYSICLSTTVFCWATASACASYSIFKSANSMIEVNVVEPALIPTSIRESIAVPGFGVYPNPSHDGFFVLPGVTVGPVELRLLNTLGACVATRLIYGSDPVRFDTSGIPPGIYFLSVRVGEVRSVEKVLIE